MIAEKQKLMPPVRQRVFQKSYVYEPIGKPYQNISSFFDSAWPSDHLSMLEQWKIAVSTKTRYDQRNCPADLVHSHQMFCNLVNAVWLIYKLNAKQSLPLETLSSALRQKYLLKEKEQLRDYPQYLTEVELFDPYLVITNFFQVFKLKEVHQQLYLWLNEGLSPFSYVDDFSSVNKVYKQFRKLIEASWLIHEREIRKNTKDILLESTKPVAANALQDVIKLLVNIIPIDTIYNLSKDENRLDLLIVLDRSCNTAYAAFEPLVEMATLGFEEIDCTVHNYGHLKEIINKGHLFYSVACSSSNVVYQKDENVFIKLDVSHYEWAKNEAQPPFESGMAKAVSFYQGAQNYLHKKADDMAVFMLHQACELTYRSLLKAMRGKDIKCHSPEVLRKYLKRYAPEIIGVFSLLAQEELAHLKILELAYVRARYDQHYEIDSSVLQFLNEKVGLLQETAFNLFKNRLEVLLEEANKN